MISEKNIEVKGWKTVKLGEALKIIRGIAFPKDVKRGSFAEDHIACLRTANVQHEVEWDDLWFIPNRFVKKEEQLIRPFDILISTANSYELVGKVAQVKAVPYKATLGAFISLIRVPDDYDPHFIFYQLSSPSVQSSIRDLASTTTNISNVSTGKLHTIDLKIPPLDEQQRIVARIEELFTQLDAGVAALEAVRGQVKRYRQAVLQSAVRGELTKAWRAKNYNDQSDTRDNSLPNGWHWKKVKEVGKVQLGRQRAPQHHQGLFMRPYLRVANVYDDHIDTSDVMEMNFSPEEFETYKLKFGDILLNEGQSPEFLGRPAMYRDEVPGACFQNTLIRFQAYSDLMPLYALLVFRHYMHSGRFQKLSQITTNIAHLSAGRFSEVEFPLPPLSEQKVIVDEVETRLSITNQMEKSIDQSIRQAARLRQSILQRAFMGKLL